MNYHLAQINISRLIAPLDDPKIAEFVSQLQPINALADKALGFVWRLQSESGNATDLAYNEEPLCDREYVGLGVYRDVARVCLQVKSSGSFSRPREVVRKGGRARLLSVVDSVRPHSCSGRGARAARTLPEARRDATFVLVFTAIPSAHR